MALSRRKHLPLALLLILPVAVFVITLTLHLNVMWSIILFTIIPSLYLTFLIPRVALKSAVFSAIAAGLLLTVADPIAVLSHAWYIPTTFFPFRIFGVIAIDEILWGFFTLYFIVMFYEYFFDKDKKARWWNRRMSYLLLVLSVLAAIIIALIYFRPEALNIPLGFLWFGTFLCLLPVIIELFRRPHLAGKFFLTGAYFFFHSILYEIAALKLNWWVYPGAAGTYVGTLTIFGVTMPFEEFFFWEILTAMAILSYYEFFDDDER